MGSKYERALTLKARNDDLIQRFLRQVNDGNRDKTGLRWQFYKELDRGFLMSSDMLSLGGLGSPASQSLRPTDLRELSEFCLELAAQLEGK